MSGGDAWASGSDSSAMACDVTATAGDLPANEGVMSVEPAASAGAGVTATADSVVTLVALWLKLPDGTVVRFRGGDERDATALSAAAGVLLCADTPNAVCLACVLMGAATTEALTPVLLCEVTLADIVVCFAGGEAWNLLFGAGVESKAACFKDCEARGAAAAVLLCTGRAVAAEADFGGCVVLETALFSDSKAAAGSAACPLPLTSAGAAARPEDAGARKFVAGSGCCARGFAAAAAFPAAAVATANLVGLVLACTA